MLDLSLHTVICRRGDVLSIFVCVEWYPTRLDYISYLVAVL